MKDNTLTMAVQKSGRLSEDSVKLLKQCGIRIQNGKNNLKAGANGFPLELIFLRDDDIPQYVEDGVAHAGILGLNEVLEKDKQVEVIEPLGFSKCRLSVAIPRNLDYPGKEFLNGKRIATSYPVLLEKYLRENNLNAEIHPISGSVEIAPSLGLADAIFEIVSSGGTLLSNGLKETETVLQSEAVLIAGANLPDEVDQLLQQLLFRIRSVQKAANNKYILLNAPESKLDNIISLIPGIKSPTMMPLAEKGWYSLHSVISEDNFWGVIDRLKEAGAEGILVVPIEKMVT
ncbi:MAG: ATP phosphoribosyltransferase [Bacteroidales bacterium]